ncbi:DUF4018 domain-containing protein [Bacillus toyonensis]
MLPLFFFIVHAIGPGYPVQKVVKRYFMVCIFSYISCPFSTVMEIVIISFTHYDYILANRFKS